MNPGRFFMPGYIGMRSMPISNPVVGTFGSTVRNTGIFGRIANGVRSFNWSGLLTNANKTLNVVNQAIPLVRQAGPMVNNMRSMLKIAKVFGNETTNKSINVVNNVNNIKQSDTTYNKSNELNNYQTYNDNNLESNSPNFFI